MAKADCSSLSLPFIGFLQAVGLVLYCGLIGLLIWNGEHVFGPINAPLGPILFLLLFVASALISALLILGYPFLLFWEKKKTREALKLVAYSTTWLTFFVLLLFGLITYINLS